jgi:3-oxoacyl-[acyl-carrier protein] reductase
MACADALTTAGHTLDRLARHPDPTSGIVGFDPFDTAGQLPTGPFGAVVWAQGANGSDSVLAYDRETHLELYRANALFVVETLARLLAEERLMDGARLCIVSSIWQTVGRQGKLSYMMSKAALQGLVNSAAVDLAERGILINGVLPGALDTAMTRENLSPKQIERVVGATPFARLPAVADVAALVTFLCSPVNTSITGQFVAVDLGFRNAHLV